MATAISLIPILTVFFPLLILNAVATSEIQALTAFKLALHDPLAVLDSWNPSTPSAPCDWPGIACFRGQVRELLLPRLQLSGPLSPQIGELRHLRKLSLHSNSFNSSIPRSLSHCSLLRAVYLQYNSLSGELFPSILNLTNLQVFNVSTNFLSGPIPSGFSTSLRFLDLSSNSFSGELPSNFSTDSQLQLLNLSFNNFSGEVPPSIGLLQGLQYLLLDSNRLYGTLPSAISNCSSLIQLSVEDNALRGLIPATIGSIPYLQVLSLSRNELSGSIPSSILCNVRGNFSAGLRVVKLGFNALTGIAQPLDGGGGVGKCTSSLQVIDVHENRINGVFPTWFTNITTVQVIDISRNFFAGFLPAGIGNLLRLRELRVASNSFNGSLPTDIGKCTSLQFLDVGDNRFSGEIPSFLTGLLALRTLSLGGNLFSGSVPSGFRNLVELEALNLSDNDLEGSFAEEILKMGNLSILNLSHNQFGGQVPSNIGDLKGLQVLNLSACGFSGKVPVGIGGLVKLATLDLSKQNLSGELPVELFGLPGLEVVHLEENKLSQDIPEGFSSLVSLQYLNLTSNSFSGDIPGTYGFLKSLTVLSLSKNRISGQIPEELGNCTSLQILELRLNHLIGEIPGDISRLSHLSQIDLGQNGLTGEIPGEIDKCSSLSSLLLDDNRLSGSIPRSLSKLSNLTALNLSSNSLSGHIPANISSISGLNYLNLSGNSLEGEIPEPLGGRFNDPSVFSMNKRLCGKPLHKECSNVKKRKLRKLILFIAVITGGSLLLAFCCSGYIYSLLRWRTKLRDFAAGKKPSPNRASSGTDRGRGSNGGENNGGPKLIMFNNKITYAETIEATRNFDEENVLSRGRYGLVFKSSYQDGMVLAIRRLLNGSTVEEATFRKEAESLGRVKHRNLTVLRGYYAGPPPDVKLLVYDYMPNGNLATLLQEASHQDGHVLNWPMRHLIALGIARGLAFLHSITMVHGDLKPMNVLFDADFEAHLSEFGLDKVTNPAATEASSSAAAVGSVGYVAPETVITGEATKEGDVYSFGIVLLEILTGKKPAMFNEEGDEDIVKWVKKQLQTGQVSELLEPGLLELDPELSEWEEFLLGVKVGLLCTAGDPVDRPSMSDVVFMLEGCRVGPEFPSSADPTTLPSPVVV
ncbi:Probable LRR receptor-like serine/threonine-protein kinase At4g36180 [Linum grandiflorum]